MRTMQSIRCWLATRRRELLISAALAFATLLPYAQLYRADFITLDDPGFVTANRMINEGFTWRGVGWAWTGVCGANWQPITWLTHMLDCQLFGIHAGPHHMVNVLLHLVNVVWLFWVLRRMTQDVGKSAFVAGLFALHPLHVESVAWITERKDLLCGLFWVLTVGAYAQYAEEPTAKRYALVLACFLLGLLSKPMIVTLPFVLLWLDYWPLGRLTRRTDWRRRMVEKIPLFALAAAGCGVTIWAQRGAMSPLYHVTLPQRILTALAGYAGYLSKTFWPVNLSFFYPHYRNWIGGVMPVWETVAGAGLVLGISLFALRRIQQQPPISVGWFWFLGSLVPVIGLIQVGAQSMADRYTYLPHIGLFLAVTWAGATALSRLPRTVVAGLGIGILAVLGLRTWQRVGDWHNSETLSRAALRVMPDNYLAHNLYGQALVNQGRNEEGLAHCREVVRLAPSFEIGRARLGSLLAMQGHLDEAMVHLNAAVAIAPQRGDWRFDRARVWVKQGRPREAIEDFRKALEWSPDLDGAMNDYAWLLATHPDPSLRNGTEAVRLAQQAERLTRGRNPAALDTLASAYAELGQYTDAVATGQRALDRAKANGDSRLATEIQIRLEGFRHGRPWRETAIPVAGPANFP